LVAREKLLLERRLSAKAQGFILPEDQASEKGSASRVTISGGCRRLLGISPHQKAVDENYLWKTYELNLFTGFCKKSYIFGFHQKSKPFQKSKPLDKKTTVIPLAPLPRGAR